MLELFDKNSADKIQYKNYKVVNPPSLMPIRVKLSYICNHKHFLLILLKMGRNLKCLLRFSNFYHFHDRPETKARDKETTTSVPKIQLPTSQYYDVPSAQIMSPQDPWIIFNVKISTFFPFQNL